MKVTVALHKPVFFWGTADRSTTGVGGKENGYRARGDLLLGASGKCGSVSERSGIRHGFLLYFISYRGAKWQHVRREQNDGEYMDRSQFRSTAKAYSSSRRGAWDPGEAPGLKWDQVPPSTEAAESAGAESVLLRSAQGV